MAPESDKVRLTVDVQLCRRIGSACGGECNIDEIYGRSVRLCLPPKLSPGLTLAKEIVVDIRAESTV